MFFQLIGCLLGKKIFGGRGLKANYIWAICFDFFNKLIVSTGNKYFHLITRRLGDSYHVHIPQIGIHLLLNKSDFHISSSIHCLREESRSCFKKRFNLFFIKVILQKKVSNLKHKSIYNEKSIFLYLKGRTFPGPGNQIIDISSF